MDLTYGDLLGPARLEGTPESEIEQVLKGGFHIILFWWPVGEGIFPKELNDR